MKTMFIACACIALMVSCNHQTNTPTANTPVTTANSTKGELKFLLGYQGQMPSDVGFLTNHVVERRLANIMKDSFSVFMDKAKFDRPISVDTMNDLVAAAFFSDSDRTQLSATVIIDVREDAFWADYLSGDSIIEFTDHPSSKAPGLFQ